jgi:hypothetical protein
LILLSQAVDLQRPGLQKKAPGMASRLRGERRSTGKQPEETINLLQISLIMVFTRGMRLLGVVGIVYAFILPVFGLTQTTLLEGPMHWLIQTAHLLVGLSALVLVQAINMRYEGPRRATPASARQATAPRAVR